MKAILSLALVFGSTMAFAQEMSQQEVKDFYLQNRKAFEHFSVGDKTKQVSSGNIECEGVQTPYESFKTTTILKIANNKAYSLVEESNNYCGHESNERILLMKDLEFTTYQEIEESWDMDGSKFFKISASIMEVIGTDGKIVIDYSKPGGEFEGNFGTLKVSEKYLGIVDTAGINVDGMKINVEMPGNDHSYRRVQTDKELKDIFPTK